MCRYSRFSLLLILILFLNPVLPLTRAQYARPVPADSGMVVSAKREASEAGIRMLKMGGNAVDAAVATGFALAVVYPVAGNIGGGGFMVIRLADGTRTTIDYREKAPLKAHRDMYLDEQGNPQPRLSQLGPLAVGVPGSVAGMLYALEHYGSLPREVVLQPAIELAEEGFILSEQQAARLNRFCERFMKFPSTRKYFTKGDCSTPFQAGERFVQKDLARVLREIARKGADGFYRGWVAERIVQEMQRGGGLITHRDLESYEPEERPPVEGTYRGYRIISMGPPSSGGVALIQLLNAVEPYPMNEMGLHSSQTIHLMGEAMRRVYADRAQWLGDPDFFNVPVRGLISKAYMRERMADFNPYQATPSREISHGNPLPYESTQTTHYSVVDAAGNAVSTTTTINGAYGSLVVVDGAGFFLNNEMDDFSIKPGFPNMYGLVGSEANAIAPGKRMLSSMTPTIVEDPQGRLFMVIGTPGGSTIITTVFQCILNVVDYGMNIQEAINTPRVHHQWLPDTLFYEPRGLPEDVVRNLRLRGWHVVERRSYSGRADGIVVRYREAMEKTDPSGLATLRVVRMGRRYYGGADPRGEDTAVGY